MTFDHKNPGSWNGFSAILQMPHGQQRLKAYLSDDASNVLCSSSQYINDVN
jgi:hypothetical protein